MRDESCELYSWRVKRSEWSMPRVVLAQAWRMERSVLWVVGVKRIVIRQAILARSSADLRDVRSVCSDQLGLALLETALL